MRTIVAEAVKAFVMRALTSKVDNAPEMLDAFRYDLKGQEGRVLFDKNM